LLSVAYRMLGSFADAEDVVQDAWPRWSTMDEATVRDPRAWLTVVVTRLCIDRLKSARSQREVYPGSWLPEPVATERPLDRESISLAFLVLLENLSPVERAVYLLHGVFDYSHGEIAAALEMSDAAVRQTLHRARAHLEREQPRFAPSVEDHARILGAFVGAIASGDLSGLGRLLTRDAVLWADGGGKVKGAATRPVLGADAIGKFLVGLVPRFVEPGLAVTIEPVNGWPAVVGRIGARVAWIITIETDGSLVHAVRNIVNPDKLRLPSVA